MSEVKYTNSKSDIWNAYKEVKDLLDKAQASAPKTTVEVAKEAKVEKAVKTASTIKVDDIAEAVGTLLTTIESGKGQYDEIVEAIEAKKAELQDILGLEAEANSLVAIVETKNKLVADKTAEAEDIIADAKERATNIIADAKEKESEVLASIAETKAETAKERARDEEEYNYNFARKKKEDVDSLQDFLDGKIKVVNDREDAVAEREAIADELDAKVESLVKEIETLNATTQDKIDEAVEKAKKGAEQSANIAKAMDKKTHEAEKSILEARIITLEEKVSDLTVQLDKANEAVAEAQRKVANIATSALQAQADAATVTEVSKIAANGGKK